MSPSRAAEVFARFTSPKKIKVNGSRTLYVTNGGARHVLWIANPDGTVTLEEHDARCNC